MQKLLRPIMVQSSDPHPVALLKLIYLVPLCILVLPFLCIGVSFKEVIWPNAQAIFAVLTGRYE